MLVTASLPLITGVTNSQGTRHPVVHGRDGGSVRDPSNVALPNNNPCNVFDIYDVYGLF